MKLVIDIGNTFTKIAIFKNELITELKSVGELSLFFIRQICLDNSGITSAIISSVKDYDQEINLFLESKLHLMKFDHITPLPFRNEYGTPETLGKDRMAAVAGVSGMFPKKNILVIDAGTCITYDILTADNIYPGGSISPGIQMRFKALNTFTGNLPFIQSNPENEAILVGNSTRNSILSGVQRAVIQETDGMINEYRQEFGNLTVVITGGDSGYFDKYLKNSIFAAPNLVLIGLKKILEFNEGS